MTQGTPLFLQDPSFAYAAEDFRFMVDTLFTEGVLNVSAGQLQATAPGDGSLRVLVAGGGAVIKGDDDATQGAYLARCTTAEYVSVAAPPTTGSRLDLLVYELIDPAKVALNGRPKGARFRVIAGTPTTGTPVLPTLPSTAIPLASVAVASGQSAVVGGNITDLRTQAGAATLKVGTQAQPLTSVQIAALSAAEKFAGRLVFNPDTKRGLLFDGTNAAPFGGAALGVSPLGTLNLSTTFQSVAYFIGAGYQSVNFTLGAGSGSSQSGLYGSAVSDATMFRGVNLRGTQAATLFTPSSATDAAYAGIANTTDGRVRNIRYTSDGYLRMELGMSTGTATTVASDRITWEAR